MHQERRKTRSATAAPLNPQPAAASVLEPKVSEQAWNPAAVTDGVLLLGKGGDALKRFPSVRSLATPAQREQWIKDELPGLAFSIVTSRLLQLLQEAIQPVGWQREGPRLQHHIRQDGRLKPSVGRGRH